MLMSCSHGQRVKMLKCGILASKAGRSLDPSSEGRPGWLATEHTIGRWFSWQGLSTANGGGLKLSKISSQRVAWRAKLHQSNLAHWTAKWQNSTHVPNKSGAKKDTLRYWCGFGCLSLSADLLPGGEHVPQKSLWKSLRLSNSCQVQI